VKAIFAFWNGLAPGARVRFAVAAVLIVALTVWMGAWLMRTDYAVLFSQLTQADAASIVEQLRKQKVPYALADDGTTIEVPASQVHETRLRLMSSGMPLAGGVGFEIFDKQGLGATEQSQRVSYQRALQGELARTIGTLDDVKQARVHLVLPESTLFKRDRQEARAAVTLMMKPGASLSHEQVVGVQRLVAASVAGLDPVRVVITDQRGITLSGADAIQTGGITSDARLEMKRSIEDYVTRKVAHLLDSAYGPGQAIVSVDVALNFDEIRRTVQDAQPSGVRRRREVVAGHAPSETDEDTQTSTSAHNNGNSSTDVEYEYGRRVEQVIAAPGGITRMSVGVIVPGDLDVEKQKHMTDLVRMAAGINDQRGDAIVVQALDQLRSGTSSPAVEEPATDLAPATPPPAAASVKTGDRFAFNARQALPWLIGAFVVLIIALAGFASLRRVRQVPPALSKRERQTLLLEIRKTLEDNAPLGESRIVP
jgi:flagellar M-ring protein FliF